MRFLRFQTRPPAKNLPSRFATPLMVLYKCLIDFTYHNRTFPVQDAESLRSVTFFCFKRVVEIDFGTTACAEGRKKYQETTVWSKVSGCARPEIAHVQNNKQTTNKQQNIPCRFLKFLWGSGLSQNHEIVKCITFLL